MYAVSVWYISDGIYDYYVPKRKNVTNEILTNVGKMKVSFWTYFWKLWYVYGKLSKINWN